MPEPDAKKVQYVTEVSPADWRKLAAALTGECRRDALRIAEETERHGSYTFHRPGYDYTYRRPGGAA